MGRRPDGHSALQLTGGEPLETRLDGVQAGEEGIADGGGLTQLDPRAGFAEVPTTSMWAVVDDVQVLPEYERLAHEAAEQGVDGAEDGRQADGHLGADAQDGHGLLEEGLPAAEGAPRGAPPERPATAAAGATVP